jgi:uncharacterized protein YjbI with pentapeptide repeats
MSRLSEYLERIFTDKPVTRVQRLFILSLIIVTLLSLPFWLADYCAFFENVMVEAHGLLFDLLILGIFLTWLSERAEQRREQLRQQDQRNLTIQRYQEEIDDYRGWDEKEAMYRITGLIRRLNKLNAAPINLHRTFLSRADLSSISLKGADLYKADLRSAILYEADLHNAKLYRAILGGANLYQADLRGADLRSADLEGADLYRADLRGANLYFANLRGADLRGTDLRGADLRDTKLTLEQLTSAQTYEGAKLPDELSGTQPD